MPRRTSFPNVTLIQPVLTTPFHREVYVYEEKYDGWRMVAYKDDRHVRLMSRRGVEDTERFADIAATVARLPARVLNLTARLPGSPPHGAT